MIDCGIFLYVCLFYFFNKYKSLKIMFILTNQFTEMSIVQNMSLEHVNLPVVLSPYLFYFSSLFMFNKKKNVFVQKKKCLTCRWREDKNKVHLSAASLSYYCYYIECLFKIITHQIGSHFTHFIYFMKSIF